MPSAVGDDLTVAVHHDPVAVADVVDPGNCVPATLHVEEVDSLPEARFPGVVADGKGLGSPPTGAQEVRSGLAEAGKIHHLELADFGRHGTHLARERRQVGFGIHQLKCGGVQVARNGILRRAGLVSGLAEGDFAGGYVPSFVMIGLDLFQFDPVDIELRHARGAGLHALHAIGEIDSGHFVARQVGNFPHHVVPFAIAENDVVDAHLAVGIGDVFGALVVELHDQGDHTEPRQVGIDPRRHTVPFRPVLPANHAPRRGGAVVAAGGNGFVADGGTAQAERGLAALDVLAGERDLAFCLIDIQELPRVQALGIVQQLRGQNRFGEPAGLNRLRVVRRHGHSRWNLRGQRQTDNRAHRSLHLQHDLPPCRNRQRLALESGNDNSAALQLPLSAVAGHAQCLGRHARQKRFRVDRDLRVRRGHRP